MKPETFVTWSEGYYGAKYNPVCRAELLTWLAEREPHFIAGLRERVRDEYSNVYRMPPDIAKLQEIHGVRPQETYDRGRRVLQIATQRSGRAEIEEELASDEQIDEINAKAREILAKARG